MTGFASPEWEPGIRIRYRMYCFFSSRLADQKDRKVSPAIEQSRSRSRPGPCLWSRGGRCEASKGPGHEYMSEQEKGKQGRLGLI